jgi:hypothetical protein
MKTRHVFAVPDIAHARAAIRAAREAGVPDDNLSLIARSDIEIRAIHDRRKDASSDFMPAALRGAFIGGGVGLLTGLATLAFPELGVTWVGVALMALGGAAVGTWASALVGSSVQDPVRRKFEQEIRAGKILLVIDAENDTRLPVAEAAILAAGAAVLPYETPSALT